MARLAEKKDCITMVGFNRRYIPLMQEAHGLVSQRGPLSQCVATFYKNRIGGGMYFNGAIDILHCDAIHAVDTLRWMAGGNVARVASSVRPLYDEHETCWLALVQFDSGCVGVLLANWTAGARRHTFEMHGRGISAFLDPDEEGHIVADNGKSPTWSKTVSEAAGDSSFHKTYGFFGENRSFIDCLQKEIQAGTNFEDAIKTMELADLIERQAF
jgi:virulence factor